MSSLRRKRVENRLRGLFAEGRVFHSESASGKFVLEQKEKEGADFASIVLGVLLRTHPPIPLDRAVAMALFWETGLESRVAAVIQKTEGDLSALGVRLATELDQIRKRYREEIAFRDSVTYWTDKAKRHCEQARVLLVGLVFSVGAAAIVTILAAQFFLAGSDRPPAAWSYVLVALIGSLSIWVGKLVTQLFLSQKHLEIDAEERAILLKTYLALHDEGKAVADADRQMILQALFRSAATGIVRDDATPATPTELVARVVQQKSGS